MKAIRFHTHGGPEVLTYEDVPDPAVPAGWALVRVLACALNHLDLFQRRGLDRVTIPMPHISGADVAGDVVEVNADVPGISAGMRVMLQPGLSCGRCAACLAGADNLCPAYDVLGYHTAGGYAELVAVPVANLIPIPETLDVVAAAAFPLTFLTAWHMLVTLARMREGETVLVLGAGSGVGQAAVQIARFFHARVIATAGTEEKRDRARALGADEVLDHRAEGLVKDVKRLTGRGVDIVVEHIGVATWEASVRSLARGGRLVTCGATTGHDARINLQHLFARQLSIIGSYMGGKAELLRATDLFVRGVFRPVVDRTFPLADAADAHRYLESGRQFGKVVLIPSHD